MSPHSFLDHPKPIAFAHRGGSLEAEENTMPAFERAVGLGYTHVETDIHATRDGVAVVHHDETLMRIAGRPERLDALSWAELSAVRTKEGAGIPRLDQLLAELPGLHVNIEAKSDAAIGPMAEAVRRAGALGRIGVGSFSGARTRAARMALGEGLAWSPAHLGVLAMWLAGFGLPIRAPGYQAMQVPTHHRGIEIVTPRLIAAAHARGVQVHVWTVNEEAEMERLLDLGVDGLMSDRPTLLRSVLRRRGMWRAG